MRTKIKLILLVVAIAAGTTAGMAQTTIGADIAPIEGAILDLKQQEPTSANVTATKGVVMPRVSLTAKGSLSPLVSGTPSATVKNTYKGTVVYNLAVVGQALKKGLYVWDGNEWDAVDGDASWNYFYMPPFELPLATATGQSRTINLYEEYIKRFTHSNTTPSTTNPLYMTSSGNTFTLPGLYQRNELDYVVLDHSSHITVTSVTATGNMTYTTNSFPTGNDAYINIIFVIKE